MLEYMLQSKTSRLLFIRLHDRLEFVNHSLKLLLRKLHWGPECSWGSTTAFLRRFEVSVSTPVAEDEGEPVDPNAS